MTALLYEHFVRSAFETKERYETQNWNENLILVERSGDPARLADASHFNSTTLSSKVKIGTAYAMEVYNSLFRNHKPATNDISVSQDERMESIVLDVLNADSNNQIAELINEYSTLFIGPLIPKLQVN